MAPAQICPIGFAIFFPAMSGADPWTGSNKDGKSFSGLIFPEGATPIVPVHAGPKSDKISPKRFDPTTTLNFSGFKTKWAHKMSMWYLSNLTSGKFFDISSTLSHPSKAS